MQPQPLPLHPRTTVHEHKCVHMNELVQVSNTSVLHITGMQLFMHGQLSTAMDRFAALIHIRCLSA